MAVIPSKEKQGTGLIGEYIPYTLWATICLTPYQKPIKPGNNTSYPTGAIQDGTKIIKDTWEHDQLDFVTGENFQHAIKNKIIAAIFTEFIKEKTTRRKDLQAYRAMNWWNISWYGMEISPSQSKISKKRNSEMIIIQAYWYIKILQNDRGRSETCRRCKNYMATRTNSSAELRPNKKYGIYKDEGKGWTKKEELDKIWNNFKAHFIETNFELNEDNELNRKHDVFVADDTIDQPDVEEAHMADALKNLANAITSETTNLNNLALTKANLTEQLKVTPSQNKVLAYLLSKTICNVTETKFGKLERK